jgi:hypothetical protein
MTDTAQLESTPTTEILPSLDSEKREPTESRFIKLTAHARGVAQELRNKIVILKQKQSESVSLPDISAEQESFDAKQQELEDLIVRTESEIWDNSDEDPTESNENNSDKESDTESHGEVEINPLVLEFVKDRNSNKEYGKYLSDLLEQFDEETLPIIVMEGMLSRNGYKVLGGDAWPLVQRLEEMDKDTLEAILQKSNPHAAAVVRILRDDPLLLSYQRSSEEKQPYFDEIDAHLSAVGLELLNSQNTDIQEYGVRILSQHMYGENLGGINNTISDILERTDSQQLMHTILKYSGSRTREGDQSAAEIIFTHIDKIQNTFPEEYQQFLVNAVEGAINSKDFNEEYTHQLAPVINVTSEDMDRTIFFLREIKKLNGAQSFDGEDFQQFAQLVEASKDPQVLELMKELKGFGLEPLFKTIEIVKSLGSRDELIGKIQSIRSIYPEYQYHFKTVHKTGEILVGPYDVLIESDVGHPDRIRFWMKNVDKLPEGYQPKAKEKIVTTLIRNIRDLYLNAEGNGMFPKDFGKDDKRAAVKFAVDFIKTQEMTDKTIYTYNLLSEAMGRDSDFERYLFDSFEFNGRKFREPKPLGEKIKAQLEVTASSESLYSFVYELLDPYRYPLNESVYDQSVKNAQEERDFALTLYPKITDPYLKEMAAVRICEYLLDPDLGDVSKMDEFQTHITNPSLASHIAKLREAIVKRREAGIPPYADAMEKVREESAQNLEELISEFGYDTEEMRQKLEEEATGVRESMSVTINLPYETMIKVLKGSKRFMTSWESGQRNGDYVAMSYNEKRDAIERSLGIRAKGNRSDPHPVYGAVASHNGRDEYFGGAGGHYGDTFITLDAQHIRNRTMFTFGDSFGQYVARPLVWEDAVHAKALLNLTRRVNYVEAQVLGGVTLDDVETINIPSIESVPTMLGVAREVRGEEKKGKIQKEMSKLQEENPHLAIRWIDVPNISM